MKLLLPRLLAIPLVILIARLDPQRVSAAESSPKPNIIFILADDMGYGDLACYGHPTIATPNLDHMVSEGMKFTEHNPPLLFNVETNAAEKFDYAADHPDIVAELSRLIEQQKAAVKPGALQK